MTKKEKNLLIIGAIVLLIIISIICLFTFKGKEKTTYTVTFDSRGGTSIAEQEIEEGWAVSKPADPKKEGYIFVEWLLDGKSYNFNSIIDKNITLIASWKENTPGKELITIKFNTDGGTTIANAIIEKNSKLSKPTNPTKEGYTFVEWQLNGKTFNFETNLNANTELVAKWEKNKNSSNNSGSNTNKTNNTSGNNTSQPKPTPTPTPTEKKYTVSFNSNGGSTVLAQTIVEGKKVTKPANPTKSGYTFVEWQLDGRAFDFNTSITKNITLTAKWRELETYTVSFNSNGGTSVSTQNVKEGNKATKPTNPTKEGYNFNSWQLNGQNYNFNNVVTGSITLVATWTQKTYTVKVSSIDQYSPDRILTVYEDGVKINVSSIKYGNTTLCSGSNLVVNMYEIDGINSVTVILSGGTSVTASVS